MSVGIHMGTIEVCYAVRVVYNVNGYMVRALFLSTETSICRHTCFSVRRCYTKYVIRCRSVTVGCEF